MSCLAVLLGSHEFNALLSGLVEGVAIWTYVREVRAGRTKPNAITFLLWTCLAFIAAVGQVKAGASLSLVILIVFACGTGYTARLALGKYGYRHYGWKEFSCSILAVAAAVFLVRQPSLTVVLSVVGDGVATFPLLIDAWENPRNEHRLSWFLSTAAAVFSIFATDVYDTANLAYPIYLAGMNGVIFAVTVGRRWFAPAKVQI